MIFNAIFFVEGFFDIFFNLTISFPTIISARAVDVVDLASIVEITLPAFKTVT